MNDGLMVSEAEPSRQSPRVKRGCARSRVCKRVAFDATRKLYFHNE